MSGAHQLAGILSTHPASLSAWRERNGEHRELCRDSADFAAWLTRDADTQLIGMARDDTAILILIGAPTDLNRPPDASELGNADRFAAHCLRRYRAEGARFLGDLDGHHALLLHDREHGETLLTSDPHKLRNWFYRATDDGLEIASSLPALRHHSPNPSELNRDVEDFFLSFGYHPFQETVYAGVSVLPPGAILRWRAGEWGIETRPPPTRPPSPPAPASIDGLHAHFERAIRMQSVQSERAAVLLGGVDSALVAAFLVRQGKQVETFSFAYEDQRYNQPYADELAAKLGIHHHWITITPDVLADGLAHYGDRFNAPSNLPNYIIQTDHLCRIIRERGHTHVYTGDGCDAIFMGYPKTYVRTRLITRLPPLPRWLTRMLLLLIGHPSWDRAFGHPYRVLLTLLRSAGRTMPTRAFATLRLLDTVSLRALDGRDPGDAAIEHILDQLAAPLSGQTALRIGYAGKAMSSPNRTKIIGSEDNHGLVLNSPYFDAGLKRFALALDDAHLRPDNSNDTHQIGKSLLLKMAEAHDLLPPEIIYQPKVAAVIGPVDTWYRNELNETLRGLLAKLPFTPRADFIESLFRDRLTERLYREHLSPSGMVTDVLSLLTTYAAFNR